MTTIDTTKHIKYLALSQLILLPLGILVSLALESHLPPLLKEYVQKYVNEITMIEGIITILLSVVAIFYVASLFGFIFEKRWAKNVYVACTLLSIILGLGIGPYVEHAFSAWLDILSSVISGMLLALLFFTNSVFNRHNTQSPST